MTQATGDTEAKIAREAWLRALQRTATIEADVNLILPVLIDRLALLATRRPQAR